MQCDVQPAAPREFRRAEGAVEAPVTGTCRRGRSDTSIGSGWRPLVLLDTFGHFWTLLDTFRTKRCPQDEPKKRSAAAILLQRPLEHNGLGTRIQEAKRGRRGRRQHFHCNRVVDDRMKDCGKAARHDVDDCRFVWNMMRSTCS